MLRLFNTFCLSNEAPQERRIASSSILEKFDRERYRPDARVVSDLQYVAREWQRYGHTWYSVTKIHRDYTRAQMVLTNHVVHKLVKTRAALDSIMTGYEALLQGQYHAAIATSNLGSDNDHISLRRELASQLFWMKRLFA